MGPVAYDPRVVRDLLASNGCDVSRVPNTLITVVVISTFAIKPVLEIKPGLLVGQKHTDPIREVTATHVKYTWSVVNMSLEELVTESLETLSNIHNHYETELFEYNGILIRADIEARINAKATLDLFTSGAITSTKWRGKEIANPGVSRLGDVNVKELKVATIPLNSINDVLGVFGAIVDYLNSGFLARSAVEDTVLSLTYSELVAYDIRAEFYGITQQ
jgi:hypothetical protein